MLVLWSCWILSPCTFQLIQPRLYFWSNQLLIKPMSFSYYPNACNNCYDSIIFFVKYICSFKWQEIKPVICKDVWIRKLLYSYIHNEQGDNIIMLCILTPSNKKRKKKKAKELAWIISCNPSFVLQSFYKYLFEVCKEKKSSKPSFEQCFSDTASKNKKKLIH